MVPMRTNEPWAGVSSRNFVMKPIETTPTMGQNRSSKKKNTLREAMMKLRTTTAHTASHSARQLNEDLLELGLADLDVAHHHPIADELDRKSTRLNSSHSQISYAVFCLKK